MLTSSRRHTDATSLSPGRATPERCSGSGRTVTLLHISPVMWFIQSRSEYRARQRLPAAEQLLGIEGALVKLDEWREAMPRHIGRIRLQMPLGADDPILDIGSAQGAMITALKEFGFTDVRGVEP